MSQSWKMTAYGPRSLIERALLAHEEAWDWDAQIVLSGSEVAEDRPDDWRLEAWLPRRPRKADKDAIAALFSGDAPEIVSERLPDVDWLTQSQQGLEPIRAGAFRVHTPQYAPLDDRRLHDFVIPASQAFGTGHHATTAGCLAMLTHIRRQGTAVRNLADIGTGSGLLAFAALRLWPRALATASDIDPVCIPVIEANAAANRVPLGASRGALTLAVADGMDHPVLAVRAPYDLVIANILAGPLIGLAPDFARALVPGGHLVLAGLLESQEAQVRRACRLAGLRLAARLVRGDWSILWLRKRTPAGARAFRSGSPRRKPAGR